MSRIFLIIIFLSICVRNVNATLLSPGRQSSNEIHVMQFDCDWFIETNDNDDWRTEYKISKQLVHKQSVFQKIDIFETPSFGRMLALDGLIQTTEKDEAIYHEMLVHVPLLTHGKAENVLIIGGGDGGALREVLRHNHIGLVILVDIDEEVINLCKIHLSKISNGAFDNHRAKIIIQDAAEFIKSTNLKFDVILCDSTVNRGVGSSLFTSNFYANCKKCLKKKGILVCQTGVPFCDYSGTSKTYQILKTIFLNTTLYTCSVPSYTGGLLTFTFASDLSYHNSINAKKLQKRLKQIRGTMEYYTPELHMASFQLPCFLQKINDFTTVRS